jgi:predicted nucleotidyltransferase
MDRQRSVLQLGSSDLDAVASYLSENQEIVAGYCFGSQARRNCPAPRDIDIALLAAQRLALDELLALRRGLSLLLKSDRLDIVDLRAAGPVLRRNVIAANKRFFCRDEHAANDFEMRALADYRDSAYRRRRQLELLRADVSTQ